MTVDFSEKTVLITGGTGSFGSNMVRHLLGQDIKEVRILSRDEAKQDLMRHELNSSNVSFYLGDVRERESVERAVDSVDFVFHAAALKQVPSVEFFPLEAVKTNVLGSANVLKAAIAAEVESIVFLSTDKAVYPINAMGQTKALMEKTAVSFARANTRSSTKIAVTRYGNVLASRGSVVPKFIAQVKSGEPITITRGDMTRFLMSLGDSVALVLHAFETGTSGDTFVKKAPAATVSDLAQAVCNLLGKPNHPVSEIGIRHGEKLFESLLSSEERAYAVDSDDFFRVPLDSRGLDYAIYNELGSTVSDFSEAYTSHNTNRLDVGQIETLLSNLPEVVKEL